MSDANVNIKFSGSGSSTGGATASKEKLPKGLTSSFESMKAGLSSMLVPLTAIVGGVALVVSAVNLVSEKISKMTDKLKDVSARLSSLDKIQKRTFDSVLKPFGDFVSTLARPYIKLMRTVARQSIRKSRNVLRQEKEGLITSDEAQTQLMEIMAATSLAMEPLKRGMLDAIGPMAGFMAGLEDTQGLSDWLDKSVRDVTNYIDGIINSASLNAIPATWTLAGEMLGTAVSDNVTSLEKLPPQWKLAYESYKDLPTELASTLTGFQLLASEIPDIISGTPGSFEAFKTALKTVNEKAGKLTGDFSNVDTSVLDLTHSLQLSLNPVTAITSYSLLAGNALRDLATRAGNLFRGGGFDLSGGIDRTFGKMSRDFQEKGAGDFFGDVAKGIFGFAEGGVVPNTGLALVHKGETVVPENKSQSLGGGNFTHNYYGVDASMADTIRGIFKDELNRSGIYGQ